MSIAQINAELEAAEQRVRELRAARSAALIAACPHKAGDVFFVSERGEFKVRSVAPAAKGESMWLDCYFRTSAGKWSQRTRVVSYAVNEGGAR